jgi:GNAT superfamily N-acetyltransferase
MPVEIRRLLQADQRAGFDCGQDDENEFFHIHLEKNEFAHRCCATYVATDGPTVLGYATVVAGSVDVKEMRRLRKDLPGYPNPVLKLARMGTAVSVQRRGIGKELVARVFAAAERMASEYGCVAVTVDARASRVSFYENLGFRVLKKNEGNETVFMCLRLSSAISPGGDR